MLTHPEVLGSDVMIVTSEFNQWASDSGVVAADLMFSAWIPPDAWSSLNSSVTETGSCTSKALTYAALVSGFTEEALASAHAAWLTKRGRPTDPEQALEFLREHADGPLDAEILSVPRIVLIAGQFLPQVVTTAVYMTRFNHGRGTAGGLGLPPGERDRGDVRRHLSDTGRGSDTARACAAGNDRGHQQGG